MKKIVSDNELYKYMEESINLLCNTVKTTLGPKGKNVIIDHSSFSPFITNDGVTIAENIESEDEVINTILTLAKEASIKTNETVGDGTTTTLVLLQGIFNKGLKLINEGINPIILKRELNNSLDNILKELKKQSKIPNNKDLLNIATISSNDILIGKLVSEAYINTKSINAIELKETNDTNTYLEYLNGYSFETILASNLFLNDNEITYNNSNILIINNTLNDIEEISLILNEIIKNNESLVIIANDYDEYLVQNIIDLNISNDLKICLLKSPEYGIKQLSILKDIACIANTKIIDNNITLNNLGKIKSITINNETTTLSFNINEIIKKHIKELKNELLNSNDIEFLEKRIAMFETKLATIYIGAPTTLERREIKMRMIDALCAINSASNGILPGEGITLLKISEELNINNNADKIFKNALSLPFNQIINNAGLDNNEILSNIKKNNYTKIYNIYNDNYEDINNTEVIDPTEVVINSLKNATSIVSMLLTTSNLIINEYKNNINKVNDYNEL